MWPVDGEEIQELEQWSNSMAKLQSLVDKANWADAGSKAFAEHLCEDLRQRIQHYKAHLAKKSAEGKKPELQVDDPADKETIMSNTVEVGTNHGVHECSICGLEFAIGQALGGHMRRHRAIGGGFQHGLGDREKKRARLDRNLHISEVQIDDPADKEMIRSSTVVVGTNHGLQLMSAPPTFEPGQSKPRSIARKKQQRGDRGGRNKRKIVFRTLSDGHQWRKYGKKMIKNNKYPRSYFKCYYNGCPALRFVQRSDADPNQFEITYRRKHTCGNNSSGSLPPAQLSQAQNLVVIVSETREEADDTSNSVQLSHHSFVRIGASTGVGHINQAQQEHQQSKSLTSLPKVVEIIQQAPGQGYPADQQNTRSTALSIWSAGQRNDWCNFFSDPAWNFDSH